VCGIREGGVIGISLKLAQNLQIFHSMQEASAREISLTLLTNRRPGNIKQIIAVNIIKPTLFRMNRN